MYLLQETKIDINPYGTTDSIKIDSREAEIFGKAKKEFEKMLGQPKKGTELIKAVFGLMDELNEEYLTDNQIVCSPGCSFCCHQLVCCTTLEMQVIVSYIKSLAREKHRAIKQRVKKRAQSFYRFFEANKVELVGKDDPMTMVFLKTGNILSHGHLRRALMKAYRGRPCPFLANDLCSIYSVRPLDCRSARTKDAVCGQKLSEIITLKRTAPKTVKLFLDQVAANIVADEQERVFGQIFVVALASWPMSDKFGSFFFSKGGANWKKKKKKRKRK